MLRVLSIVFVTAIFAIACKADDGSASKEPTILVSPAEPFTDDTADSSFHPDTQRSVKTNSGGEDPTESRDPKAVSHNEHGIDEEKKDKDEKPGPVLSEEPDESAEAEGTTNSGEIVKSGKDELGEPAEPTNSKADLESDDKEETLDQEESLQNISHDLWDELLSRYVDDRGRVNYRGMKDERAKLNRYLNLLASNVPDNSWSRSAEMAYWINAYNAFTVDLILKNYPLKSIMDLDGGKTWDIKRITLGGKSYSLNQIEHDILRPKFKDARIHFAVNCAAQSCPKLWNRAWTASNLDANLQRMTREFISSSHNDINAGRLRLSRLFDWYAEDFGDIRDFVDRYSSVKVRPDALISFMEYDWALNDQ